MAEPTNYDRAAWAAEALDEFCGLTFGRDLATTVKEEQDPGIPIGDFLCNLMHLCDQNGWEFDDFLSRARCHFEEELEEAKFTL